MKEVFLLLKKKLISAKNKNSKIKKGRPNTFIIVEKGKIFCLLSGEIKICQLIKKKKNSKNNNLDFLKKKKNFFIEQKIVKIEAPNFIEIIKNFSFVLKTGKKEIEYINLEESFFERNLKKNNFLIFKKKLNLKLKNYNFYFKKSQKIFLSQKINNKKENINFQKYKKKNTFAFNINLKKKIEQKKSIWDVKKILKQKSCNIKKRIFLKPIIFPIKKIISEFEKNKRLEKLNKVKKKNLKKIYTALKLFPPSVNLIRQSMGRLKAFLR